jgi:hypothetical protein
VPEEAVWETADTGKIKYPDEKIETGDVQLKLRKKFLAPERFEIYCFTFRI